MAEVCADAMIYEHVSMIGMSKVQPTVMQHRLKSILTCTVLHHQKQQQKVMMF